MRDKIQKVIDSSLEKFMSELIAELTKGGLITIDDRIQVVIRVSDMEKETSHTVNGNEKIDLALKDAEDMADKLLAILNAGTLAASNLSKEITE